MPITTGRALGVSEHLGPPVFDGWADELFKMWLPALPVLERMYPAWVQNPRYGGCSSLDHVPYYVYHLYNFAKKSARPVYVGMTKNPKSRLGYHKNAREFDYAVVFLLTCSAHPEPSCDEEYLRFITNQYEISCINEMKPEENKRPW